MRIDNNPSLIRIKVYLSLDSLRAGVGGRGNLSYHLREMLFYIFLSWFADVTLPIYYRFFFN